MVPIDFCTINSTKSWVFISKLKQSRSLFVSLSEDSPVFFLKLFKSFLLEALAPWHHLFETRESDAQHQQKHRKLAEVSPGSVQVRAPRHPSLLPPEVNGRLRYVFWGSKYPVWMSRVLNRIFLRFKIFQNNAGSAEKL